MSKVINLVGLKNEESLYMVVGLFDSPQVCYIEEADNSPMYVVTPVLGDSPYIINYTELGSHISKGTIRVTCLQGGV